MEEATGQTQATPPPPGPRKGSGRFSGEVLALGTGAAVAHVVAFGCAPIVSRLYAPEAFGAAAMFSAVVLVIGVAATLRYESALMLPARDDEAANLLVVSCAAVAVFSVLLAVAVGLAGEWPARAMNADAIADYFWLLPVGVATWAMSLPLRAWASRHRRYRSLAVLNAVETSTSSGLRIAAGAAGHATAAALIVSLLVARAVQPVALAARMASGDLRFIVSNVSLRGMAAAARRYARFPLIDSWSSVLGQLAGQLPFVLLGASLGTAVAGQFSRAVLIGQAPFLLAGNSIRQVFFQRAAAAHAAGEPLAEIVAGVLRRLIWMSLLPMALLALIGPELLTVVLGGQWGQAGTFAALLAAWLFFQGVALPLSGLFGVLGKLAANLAFSAALVGGQVAGLAVGGWVLGDSHAAVALLATAGLAVHATMTVFILRAAGVSVTRAGGMLAKYAAFAAPTLAVAAGAKWWLGLPAWQVVVLSLAASISYAAAVIRDDDWARRRLADAGKAALGRLGRS
jgi:O-antigen/teichoic acid export membrane protein